MVTYLNPDSDRDTGSFINVSELQNTVVFHLFPGSFFLFLKIVKLDIFEHFPAFAEV